MTDAPGTPRSHVGDALRRCKIARAHLRHRRTQSPVQHTGYSRVLALHIRPLLKRQLRRHWLPFWSCCGRLCGARRRRVWPGHRLWCRRLLRRAVEGLRRNVFRQLWHLGLLASCTPKMKARKAPLGSIEWTGSRSHKWERILAGAAGHGRAHQTHTVRFKCQSYWSICTHRDGCSDFELLERASEATTSSASRGVLVEASSISPPRASAAPATSFPVCEWPRMAAPSV